MAVDKLVDSTQLDADLTSVANAIRAKSGGSGQLAFPSGFVSEIGDIPSGGGVQTWVERHGILYQENMVIPEKDSGGTTIGTPRYVREQFQGATHLKSYIQQYGTPANDASYGLFRECSNLETVWVARATFDTYSFSSCNALKHIMLGRVGLAVTSLPNNVFNGVDMTHIEDITVYVNASDLSGVPSAVKDRITPSHSPGAVITYKNYQSGDTIATVTVS